MLWDQRSNSNLMLDLSVAIDQSGSLGKTTAFLNVIITNYDELSFSKGIQLYYSISQYIRGFEISFPNKTKLVWLLSQTWLL